MAYDLFFLGRDRISKISLQSSIEIRSRSTGLQFEL